MPICDRFMGLFYSDIPVSNKCCDIMKKNPINNYIKETGGKPIIATLAAESRQRTNGWVNTGCNNFDKRNPMSKPLSFWTEQDILEYLHRYNVPYSSIYGDILMDENGKYYTSGAKTRARERLIMTYCAASLDKTLNSICQNAVYPVKPDEAALMKRIVMDVVKRRK